MKHVFAVDGNIYILVIYILVIGKYLDWKVLVLVIGVKKTRKEKADPEQLWLSGLRKK